MTHGSNNSNIGILLQRQDVIVVLQQNDALLVDLLGQSNMFIGMDVVVNLVIRDAGKGVLEKALLKLGAEDASDGSVDNFLVQRARFDEVRDILEAPAATTHLNIVTSGEGLQTISQVS